MGRPERMPAMSATAAHARRPIVVVTGALAPYTHVLYERLAERLDRPLHVLSCTPRETARQWVVEAPLLFRHAVLPGLRWHRDAVRNLYVNPAVVPRLAALDPAVIVLNDFSPTMLMAAGYARLRRIPYLIRTDGVRRPIRGSVRCRIAGCGGRSSPAPAAASARARAAPGCWRSTGSSRSASPPARCFRLVARRAAAAGFRAALRCPVLRHSQ